jgi:hypothetical protein
MRLLSNWLPAQAPVNRSDGSVELRGLVCVIARLPKIQRTTPLECAGDDPQRAERADHRVVGAVAGELHVQVHLGGPGGDKLAKIPAAVVPVRAGSGEKVASKRRGYSSPVGLAVGSSILDSATGHYISTSAGRERRSRMTKDAALPGRKWPNVAPTFGGGNPRSNSPETVAKVPDNAPGAAPTGKRRPPRAGTRFPSPGGRLRGDRAKKRPRPTERAARAPLPGAVLPLTASTKRVGIPAAARLALRPVQVRLGGSVGAMQNKHTSRVVDRPCPKS